MSDATTLATRPRVALVGSPNAGKTTVFNALTGLRARTGNYPGVTVARGVGTVRTGDGTVVLEDLPGTYSLAPISPDEAVVAEHLAGRLTGAPAPDAILAVVDATTLRRSLSLVAEVLALGRPTAVVVTMTDELALRSGHVDLGALGEALGAAVHGVVGHRRTGLDALRSALARPESWPRPPVPPPSDAAERGAWIDSVLAAASFRPPGGHRTTERVDAVLLHPVWGSAVFLAVMTSFFQAVFVLAAPAQAALERLVGAAGAVVRDHVAGMPGALLADGVIGGVGGVLTFVPQIALLFLLLAALESVGYLARAAFLMDRVMSRVGLEGRAFVALLSSVACAVPGIMATRSLPSARDRLATMLAAPLMTCSARLPVYVLLISLLVEPGARLGPFGLQGLVMLALYLLGAASAMAAAWVVSRLGGRDAATLPFYLEMPPYRVPTARTLLTAAAHPAGMFVRKAGTVILAATVVLWLGLNLPARSGAELAAAGVDPADDAAASAYVLEHSVAGTLGRAVEPVFEPLGFDWRIDVAVVSSLAAREVFVSTLGQLAAAEDPDDPGAALAAMTVTDGARAGEPLFTPPTVVALLVFFVYALQCVSTLAVMRRESGGWRWPLTAFVALGALAWMLAFLARTATAAVVGGVP